MAWNGPGLPRATRPDAGHRALRPRRRADAWAVGRGRRACRAGTPGDSVLGTAVPLTRSRVGRQHRLADYRMAGWRQAVAALRLAAPALVGTLLTAMAAGEAGLK